MVSHPRSNQAFFSFVGKYFGFGDIIYVITLDNWRINRALVVVVFLAANADVLYKVLRIV